MYIYGAALEISRGRALNHRVYKISRIKNEIRKSLRSEKNRRLNLRPLFKGLLINRRFDSSSKDIPRAIKSGEFFHLVFAKKRPAVALLGRAG